MALRYPFSTDCCCFEDSGSGGVYPPCLIHKFSLPSDYTLPQRLYCRLKGVFAEMDQTVPGPFLNCVPFNLPRLHTGGGVLGPPVYFVHQELWDVMRSAVTPLVWRLVNSNPPLTVPVFVGQWEGKVRASVPPEALQNYDPFNLGGPPPYIQEAYIFLQFYASSTFYDPLDLGCRFVFNYWIQEPRSLASSPPYEQGADITTGGGNYPWSTGHGVPPCVGIPDYTFLPKFSLTYFSRSELYSPFLEEAALMAFISTS
jgi:hypothetical protein